MTKNPSITTRDELLVDLYLAGELTGEESRRIEEALAANPVFKRWLDSRKTEDQDIRRDPRFGMVPRRRPRDRSPYVAVAVLAAAALFTAISLRPIDRKEAISVRGGLSVKVAIQRGALVRALQAGESLRAGDRLQLTVDDPKGGWVTVLLEDARSHQLDLMYAPEESGRLHGGSHTLPESLELDDALGEERIVVVLSDVEPDPKRWIRENRLPDASWHRMAIISYVKETE